MKPYLVVLLIFFFPLSFYPTNTPPQDSTAQIPDVMLKVPLVDTQTVSFSLSEDKKEEKAEANSFHISIWGILCGICTIIIIAILYSNRKVCNRKNPLSYLLWTSLFMCLVLLVIHFHHNEFYESDKVLTPHIEASILLISSFLTFLAFFVQFQYNNKQKNDLDDERKENNIFHFIDKLDGISHDITVKNIGSHKKAFHFIFYEIKALYCIFQTFYYKTIECLDKNLYDYASHPKELVPLCISFVLSGVTSTSNAQIRKRVLEMVHEKPQLHDYYEKNFEALENIVLCFQEIHAKELKEMKKENRLILFVDYADTQLNSGPKIPWFGGHREDLVRYLKTLWFIVEYIDKSYTSDRKDKKREFYNCIFGLMSEHEVGVLYTLCKSTHEYKNLLGLNKEKQNTGENVNNTIPEPKDTLQIIAEEWMQKTNEMYKFDVENEFCWLENKPMKDKVCDIIYQFSNKTYRQEYLS